MSAREVAKAMFVACMVIPKVITPEEVTDSIEAFLIAYGNSKLEEAANKFELLAGTHMDRWTGFDIALIIRRAKSTEVTNDKSE